MRRLHIFSYDKLTVVIVATLLMTPLWGGCRGEQKMIADKKVP